MRTPLLPPFGTVCDDHVRFVNRRPLGDGDVGPEVISNVFLGSNPLARLTPTLPLSGSNPVSLGLMRRFPYGVVSKSV